MFRAICILVFLTGWARSASYQSSWIDSEWAQFKQDHGKFYEDDQEEQYRQEVFAENLRKIAQHNLLYKLGIYTYYLGVNSFTDLTEQEFQSLYTFPLNYTDFDYHNLEDFSEDDYDDVNLPTEMDWRKSGIVTEVKNQGSCGSCWSFSATGTLEGQWSRKTKRLVSLSEQNLVDCTKTPKYNNLGCHGGYAASALKYIRDVKGIDTEANYPYEGHEDQCRFNRQRSVARVKEIVEFGGQEAKLLKKLATVGPIAIDVEVSGHFHNYRGGVYNNPQCGHNLNHAVLVVGYGREKGQDYWLVKNSWGTNWGQGGYIKMARNKKNQCGIGLRCTYPIV